MMYKGIKNKPIIALIILSIIVLGGCSQISEKKSLHPTIGQAELLSGRALFDPKVTNLSLPDADVMKLSDKMRDYLKHYIPASDSKKQKFHKLTYLMFSNGNLDITYDPTQTLTAENTFRVGSGNCLAVSYLFSSMAEELGLTTHFQKVDIPPIWGMENDIVYKYRHVNILVDLPHQSRYVIDVNMKNYLPKYKSTRISKKNAIAQYYSNKGAEYLANKDLVNAFRYFKKSIYIDPEQAEFWSNLGVLYSKEQKYDYAESAYKIALSKKQNDLTAIGNLASLYRKMGNDELWQYYQSMVETQNHKNPYLRFIKANKNLESGDYSKALSNIKGAIRRNKSEPKFYYFLAQLYEKTGQPEDAKAATIKGDKVASENKNLISGKALRIRFYANN